VRLETVNPKMIIVAIALVLSATSAALAQSEYTTGTAASTAAAGYGYGGNLYDYAPNMVMGTLCVSPNAWGQMSRGHDARNWNRKCALHSTRRVEKLTMPMNAE
jgi:hypothetical protein